MKAVRRPAKSVRLGVALAVAGALVVPALASADGGKVTGKITFDGTPPAPTKIKLDADPVCAAAHSGPIDSEELVVSNGAVKNVFVRVSEGLGDKKFPPPTDPAVIDQHGCQYIPHVVGVQVGQPLRFTTSDQTLHNVHGMPKKNAQFNFAMPKFVKQKETKDLTKPEIMVHVKCDVHPWMSGYIGVLPHPFFAVSGKDGSYTIEGLPPGEYTIEAWQEKLGTQTSKVKVDDKGTATSDFTFKAS
jgi:plastocyanin